MEKEHSFNSLGIHPTLAAALRDAGVHPTPFQARILDGTTTDFADVIIDGRTCGGRRNGGDPGGEGIMGTRPSTSERHDLTMLFVAHCVLSTKDATRCTGLVLADSKESAVRLRQSCLAFAAKCNIVVDVLTNEERKPDPAPTESEVRGTGKGSKRASSSGVRRIIITTINALCSWDKAFFASVATFATEDASCSTEVLLEEIIKLVTQPTKHPSGTKAGSRLSSSSNSNQIGSATGGAASGANIFLMCLAPLTDVTASIRYRLNRRNRRYYHMQNTSEQRTFSVPNSTRSSGQGSSGHLGIPSCTIPPASTRLLYLLYTDENDHEALLRRLLQMYTGRRVLLLTHHKEIRQLHQTVCKWGICSNAGDAHGVGCSGAKGHESAHCVLRSDAPERQESCLTSFIREQTPSGGGGGKQRKVTTSSVMIGWDAFTAVDLMDVDLVIQYYPPQKSLTKRECAEFVQVLHTTASPEVSTRCRQTVIATLLSISDFTLAAFFMEMYGVRGHILNISPEHKSFEDCLNNPDGVLEVKLRMQREVLCDKDDNSSGAIVGAANHRRRRSRRRGARVRGSGSSGCNSDNGERRPTGRRR